MPATKPVGLHIRKQSGDHTDWCHVCGKRSTSNKAEISYPDNAEHGGEAAKYIRICEKCLTDSLSIAKDEREAVRRKARAL